MIEPMKDGWMDRRVNRYVDGLKHQWMDRQFIERLVGNGQIDWQKDTWMDIQMNG